MPHSGHGRICYIAQKERERVILFFFIIYKFSFFYTILDICVVKKLIFVNIKKININIYNIFFNLYFLILVIVIMITVIITDKTVQHDKMNNDTEFKYCFSITLLMKEMPKEIGR